MSKMTKTKKTVGALSIAALSLGLVSCGNDAADEPVALADIEEAMWDSMQASESVTVTIDLPAMDEETRAAQTEVMMEMFGADFEQMSLHGAMDSSATAVSMGLSGSGEEVMRIFGDTVYMSVDFMIANAAAQMSLTEVGEEEETNDSASELRAEYADMWIDMPFESAGAEGQTPADLIAELRAGWEAEGEGEDDEPVSGPMDRTNLPEEGQPEERDGVAVWVFASEENDVELVVEADEEAPRILWASDGEVGMSFTDWDASADPVEPIPEELADPNDVNDAMMSLY